MNSPWRKIKDCAVKEVVESRRKSIKRNAIWTSSFSGQYFKIKRFPFTCEEYYRQIDIYYAALQTWNSRTDTEYFQCELTSLVTEQIDKD